jgi:hypothetical protein
VPEIFAVMDYAFYYERKASKASVGAANRGDFDRGFAQVGDQIKRSHPHMLLEGREDAAMFLKLNGHEGAECMTPTVERLYDNIARLALERRSLPPDVDDDFHYQQSLTAAARKKYGYEPSLTAVTPEQRQLLTIKQACLAFTKGAAFSMEGFCRCQVDAAVESKLPKSDLVLLETHFTQDTLTALSKGNSTYDKRKQACYQ